MDIRDSFPRWEGEWKWSGQEAGHSAAVSVQAESECTYTTTSQYAFTACTRPTLCGILSETKVLVTFFSAYTFETGNFNPSMPPSASYADCQFFTCHRHVPCSVISACETFREREGGEGVSQHDAGAVFKHT
jgi:hypothetical protein